MTGKLLLYLYNDSLAVVLNLHQLMDSGRPIPHRIQCPLSLDRMGRQNDDVRQRDAKSRETRDARDTVPRTEGFHAFCPPTGLIHRQSGGGEMNSTIGSTMRPLPVLLLLFVVLMLAPRAAGSPLLIRQSVNLQKLERAGNAKYLTTDAKLLTQRIDHYNPLVCITVLLCSAACILPVIWDGPQSFLSWEEWHCAPSSS